MRLVIWSTRLMLAGALAFAAMSCGGDDDDDDAASSNTPAAGGSPTAATEDGDEAAVEKAVRDAIAAWNAKDVNALIALFTDDGLVSSFGEGGAETREEIAAQLPEFVGDPPIEIRELSTDVSDASATAELTWEIGKTLENVQFALIEEGGAWKIDGEEDLVVGIPDGVTPVRVDLNEFAFSFIATDVTNGNVAFEAHNVGEQQHEIGLAKIPADANIDELLMTEEDVPGFEFIGGAGPLEPGDDRNLVFTEPLAPGRYVLVCFLPDTTEGEGGTPHAFKGMVEEFTVPTP